MLNTLNHFHENRKCANKKSESHSDYKHGPYPAYYKRGLYTAFRRVRIIRWTSTLHHFTAQISALGDNTRNPCRTLLFHRKCCIVGMKLGNCGWFIRNSGDTGEGNSENLKQVRQQRHVGDKNVGGMIVQSCRMKRIMHADTRLVTHHNSS